MKRDLNSLASPQAKVDNAKSKGLAWPNSAQLGDPLRAMIVCGAGCYAQPKRVWDKLNSAEGFVVQRYKVNFSAPNRPPDM